MVRIVTTRRFRKAAGWAALCIVICSVAGFASGTDRDRSVPARAVELFGAVLVNYAGEEGWRELFRMEGVRDTDRLFTGPDGEVSLRCKDGALVTLAPISGMEVERLSVETRDGAETAVTALVLTQGMVDITAGTSGRYGSDITLTASGVEIAYAGDGPALDVTVNYVPEAETVGINWRGGGGCVTVPVEHPGVVEVTFDADTAENVSLSRGASPDSGGDTLSLAIAGRPVESSIDAVIDRIVVREGGRVMLSGRTAGGGISIFTGSGGAVTVEAEEGFWAVELAVEGGDAFSPGPAALGASGDMPALPAGMAGEAFASREGREASDSSVDGEPRPPGDERDASRVARSFLADFINAVETGDVSALSGMIEPSYSGIGATRSGLTALVREYFDDADTLRITWSVVRIDETEEGIVATISWSSSAGASGVSSFWLSDTDGPSLSHAEGDWFF